MIRGHPQQVATLAAEGLCTTIELKDKNFSQKEMPLEGRDIADLTGLSVVSDKNWEKKSKRVEKDGILMIVTAKIYGKRFKALIDSGVTRCFVTPECCIVVGLSAPSHGTLLELGYREKALSRGLVRSTPVSVVGVTRKIDLIVSKLLHDVDIMLDINWLESVNPIIDWCGGKIYLPNAIHTAFLWGSWLDQQFKIGTVKIISTHEGLEEIKNEDVKNQLAIIKPYESWRMDSPP